jgi:hypothetical protein
MLFLLSLRAHVHVRGARKQAARRAHRVWSQRMRSACASAIVVTMPRAGGVRGGAGAGARAELGAQQLSAAAQVTARGSRREGGG